ncbi:hypothetical protein D7Z26_01775 [Cohnella endophytica]|uniref:DUF5808 domain-containing protein n=1 Tax=Cohnella endophytica TaxID=2419778 RepID=A0A494Y6F7_9BACL|nr:DUF5808 domain-containing protein [Cohnella endophytica]RKP58250.1 hypothetical protein D7Z26_01775 [Cohnella endophytica]
MAQETMIMMSSFYLIIASMLSLLVYMGLRTLMFGITLPAEALQDAAVRGIRRKYVLLIGGFAVVVGGVCFFLTRHQTAGQNVQYWTTAILLLMIVSVIAIRISRMSAQRLKAARGWQVVVQTRRAASLAIDRKHSSVLSTWWFSAHVAVMLLCIFFAIARWDEIPQWFGTHMGPNGFADHYTYKSVRTVFMLNIVQVLMISLFAGFNLMIGHARISLDPKNPEGSLQKQLKLKKIHSITAWGLSLLRVANLGLTQAVTLHGWKFNLLFRYGIAFQAAFFLVLIGVMLYQRIRGLDQQGDVPSQEERHWKWLGSIYANPEDPALFVPDRYGFGWTINLANPVGKIIAAATIAVLVTAFLVFTYFR